AVRGGAPRRGPDASLGEPTPLRAGGVRAPAVDVRPQRVSPSGTDAARIGRRLAMTSHASPAHTAAAGDAFARDRLSHVLPDFTRISWVGDRARSIWEPRIQR